MRELSQRARQNFSRRGAGLRRRRRARGGDGHLQRGVSECGRMEEEEEEEDVSVWRRVRMGKKMEE